MAQATGAQSDSTKHEPVPVITSGRRVAAIVRLPDPLQNLVERAEQSLNELAGSSDGRHEIHALRSAISDICALTETSTSTMRIVARVVDASDQLAEVNNQAFCSRQKQDLKRERLSAAQGALRALARCLIGARPSRIAISVGRVW